MKTLENCDYIAETNNPIDDSLYNGVIQEKLFIGFPIKNNYDHLRFVIPERYDPQRIKINDKYFYGIWVNGAKVSENEVVTLNRIDETIFSIPFGDGTDIIDQDFKNFETIVYKESPVVFYHKLAQMYIYMFLT
jgi:hypothetical protein